MRKRELRAIVTAILVGEADFYECGEGAQMIADDLIERTRDEPWRSRLRRWWKNRGK